MLTPYQLNTLACRAVWEMRSANSNYWFLHPMFRIQRPRLNPYNDFFEVYWGSRHLGNMVRPGCGRDWELHFIGIDFPERSSVAGTFSEAIAQIIKPFSSQKIEVH